VTGGSIVIVVGPIAPHGIPLGGAKGEGPRAVSLRGARARPEGGTKVRAEHEHGRAIFYSTAEGKQEGGAKAAFDFARWVSSAS
jgi:hypothetical protein